MVVPFVIFIKNGRLNQNASHIFFFWKEIRLCHKLSNPYIFATRWCKPLIFQTKIIGSNNIHSLKYLRFTTLRCKDIGIRKSELPWFLKIFVFQVNLNELSVSDWLVTDKSQIFGLVPGLSFLTGIGLGKLNSVLTSY